MNNHLTFSLLAGAASSAYASQIPHEEVIVTASLSEQRVFDVLGSASVIHQQELAQAQNLPEALQQQSGLQIVTNGGPAAQTSLFTRGTNSNHTLILINGIRFNSATLGQTVLQFIDPEQLNRVEYVKGSRSALYGSDAIGGVLQIFTNFASEKQEGYVSMQNGSFYERRLAGGVRDLVGNGFYSLALSRELSDGIDNMVDDNGFNADEDPYGITSGNLNAGIHLNEKIQLSTTHFLTHSNAHYDNLWSGATDQPYSKNEQQISSILLDAELSSWYSSKFTLGHAVDKSEDRDLQNVDNLSQFETLRSSAYWLNTFTLKSDLIINTGFDYSIEEVESTSDYEDRQGNNVDSRENAAVFSQAQWTPGGFHLSTGVRYDDNESFDAQTSANLAIGYDISKQLKVYTNWAEGFKAPTFNDLYYPGLGNPDLLPESSSSAEVGLKGQWQALQFSISAYQIEVNNLIEWADEDGDGTWNPSNVDNAEIDGGELNMSYHLNGWVFDTAMSYTDAVDARSGAGLTNRAKTKFSARIEHALGKHSTGLSFNAEGKRKVGSDQYLPGYGTLNLYTNAAISDNVSLQFKVNNLMNKDYQVDQRYNTEGTNVNMRLTYRL